MTFKVQIDDTVREATSEEVDAIKARQALAAEKRAEIVAAEEAKAAALKSARAKLAALGLTEAEVKALVG